MNTFEFPRVSIVTPSFNQAEYLEECLDSVLGQNYPNLEYIVMDGGSSDATRAILERYARHFAYWQSRPDGGQYAAINDGFARCTGQVMAWINSDDMLAPGSLRLVAEIFSRRKEVDWITPRPVCINGKSGTGSYLGYCPLFSQDKYFRMEYHKPFIQQEGTFWRRRLWEKAGGYLSTEYDLAGDCELWSRFFRHADLYTVDHMLGYFRSHPAQKTHEALPAYCAQARDIALREKTLFCSSGPSVMRPAPPRIRVENGRINDIRANVSLATPCRIPSVSVIVTVLNENDRGAGVLASLAEQQFSDFEVVVISSGGAPQMPIVEMPQNVRHIRVVEAVARGVALNAGIAASAGEFLCYLDHADRLTPDHLQCLVDRLRQGSDVAFADYFWNAGGDTRSSAPVHVDAFDRHRLLKENHIPLPAMMHRRRCLDETGWYDENLTSLEDWDFLMRLSRSYDFAHIPHATCFYHWRQVDPTSLSLEFQDRIVWSHQIVGDRGRIYLQQDLPSADTPS